MSGNAPWPTTSATLLKRMRKSADGDAWYLFVQVYAPLVYKYCRKHGLQDSDANEVTQIVLVQVSRVIGRFEYNSERGKFRGWLGLLTRRSIGHFVQRNETGDRSAIQNLTDADLAGLTGAVDPEWLDHFQSSIYETAVKRIRSEFSDQAWDVFEQLCRADGDPRAVAAKLQKPIEWIYKTKHRLQQRLAEEVQHLAEDSVHPG